MATTIWLPGIDRESNVDSIHAGLFGAEANQRQRRRRYRNRSGDKTIGFDQWEDSARTLESSRVSGKASTVAGGNAGSVSAS